MSTIDSFVFISGLTIGKDILPELIKTDRADYITHTKLGIAISAVISVILATFFENALDIWYMSGSFAVSAIFVPLLCCLYGFRVRHPLILTALPLAITALWFLWPLYPIDPMYPGLASSVICFALLRQ
jgi:Na+/pantothenate symporter